MKGNYETTASVLISQGESLISLGEALKNPKTTISDLVAAADKCGFTLEIEIVQSEPEEREE